MNTIKKRLSVLLSLVVRPYITRMKKSVKVIKREKKSNENKNKLKKKTRTKTKTITEMKLIKNEVKNRNKYVKKIKQ